MGSMSREQREAFLAVPRIAKLATLREDGGPTVVPVWFDWDGTHAWVFSARGAQKVRNILGDPRVALTVEEPVGVPEAWVTIEGRAEVLESGGMALARKLLPRYYDAMRAAEAERAWSALGDEYWALIRITPTRIRSSAPE